MEEKLAEVLLGSASAVLCLGGVLFLKVATLGGDYWPPTRGGEIAWQQRLVSTTVAIALIALAIWLLRSSAHSADGGASLKKDSLEYKVIVDNAEMLRARVELLERDSSSELAVAAVDTEIRSLRASMSVGDIGGTACWSTYAAPVVGDMAANKSWFNKASAPCELLKNAQWAVEIPGYLQNWFDAFAAKLNGITIRYVLGPKPSDFDTVNSTSLGMVFDDDAPADLVCALNDIYVSVMKFPIPYAITQKTFLTVTKRPNISSYGIRLGVPFDTFFRSDYRMGPADWKSICDDEAKFGRFFQDKASSFLPRLTAKSQRSASN